MTTPRLVATAVRLSPNTATGLRTTPRPAVSKTASQLVSDVAAPDGDRLDARGKVIELDAKRQAPGPALALPQATGVSLAGTARTKQMSASSAAVVDQPSPAPPVPASQPVSNPARVSPIPEGYQVPAEAAVQGPTLGSRILAGVKLALLTPFYAIFAALAFFPSLIAGFIEGPKEDQPGGGGTFFAGFSSMYRRIMGAFPFITEPFNDQLREATNAGGRFWVDRTTDPENVIITRRIALEGSAADVAAVEALEQRIEAHLAIPGYRVNVEFVEPGTPDAATVKIDPQTWSNSSAWNPYSDDNAINAGDAPMMAHEILHILGLPDEYDYQTHFTNQQMGFWQKLGTFFMSLVQGDRPADADQGIMDNHNRKPLPRHYEAILNQ